MVKRRRGRPRKPGKRFPGGKLRNPSPREIAASQPHRRSLGEHAVDQLAESELGRLVLTGRLAPVLATAGEELAATWRGYVATLDAPRRPYGGQGRGFDCAGCPSASGERDFCMCAVRKAKWQETARVLEALGARTYFETTAVAIFDRPPIDVGLLRMGLEALAYHFGLTNRSTFITKMPVVQLCPPAGN